MGATQRQVWAAMYALRKAGYSTSHMRSEHKRLGATMRERSGTVLAWLESMTRDRISALIDSFKK